MARRDSNVRISIVVPHLGTDGPFEDTLISILENRPLGAEVIVAHDGSYGDPFELSDEVRFVTADSNSLPTLVAVAAEHASSELVHIIANGVRATPGWIEPTIDLLQQDEVGLVAPLAQSRIDDSIVTAGWSSRLSAVTSPVALGRTQLSRRDIARVQGACLPASFWKRELLMQVHAAFPTASMPAAQYAWPQLLSRQGWKICVAIESIVLAELEMLGLKPSFAKARTERELQRTLGEQGLVSAAIRTGCTAAMSLLSPGVWGDCSGQLLGSLLPRHHDFDLKQIREPAEHKAASIRMPARSSEAEYGLRAA